MNAATKNNCVPISQEMADFIQALQVIRNFTGFGEIFIELKHGDITDVKITTHHKPKKNRIEANEE